jgi:hypothetical protein
LQNGKAPLNTTNNCQVAALWKPSPKEISLHPFFQLTFLTSFMLLSSVFPKLVFDDHIKMPFFHSDFFFLIAYFILYSLIIQNSNFHKGT